MPVAELILDNPTKEFERFYIKVKDQHTNLVIYSASIEESPRLLREVGDLPGLYILQAEDSTVYVGQSKALGGRLKTHRNSRKIGFIRILAVVRDQSLAQYLDYAEAKIYDELNNRGFRLEQAPLSGSLDTKRRRLVAQDNEHVRTADIHVHQFLNYAVALGLVKPAAALPLSVIAPQASAAVARGPVTPVVAHLPPHVVPLPPESPTRAPVALSTPPSVPAVPASAAARTPAPVTASKFTKRKSVKLLVKDANGREFEGKHSADVFVSALQHFGLAPVAALGLRLGGHPLLQKDKPQRYSGESKLVDGFYVTTHSSNKDKAILLRRVADALNVGLTIECKEPADR